MKKKKELLMNLLIAIFSLIIVIILVEASSFLLLQLKDDCDVVPHRMHKTLADDDLGYVLEPNSVHDSVKRLTNGTIVYNATYSIDEHGRRILDIPYVDYREHLLLFGGSVAFGEGLDDEDTFHYLLSENLLGYNIFNYAVSGYGPSHMLTLLESGDLKDEVFSDEGIAIYVLIPAHINRVIGNTLADWLYEGPYYVIENNEVVRRGSFRTGRERTTNFYELFNKIKDKSNFLKMINLELPPWSTKEHIELTAKVIKKSRDLYEEQFNGDFFVMFHPEWNRTEDKRGYSELIKQLTEVNINILDYSDYSYPDDKVIWCDQHPKRILNYDVALLSAQDLDDFYGKDI